MRSALVSLVVCALSYGLQPCMAATIHATGQGTVYGFTKRSAQGPANSGELLAAVRFEQGRGTTLEDSCRAIAAQSVNGVASALTECFNSFLAKTDNTLEASTSWDSVVTNTSTRLLHYVYAFRIKAVELSLHDLGMLTDQDPLAPRAQYDVEVRLNGNLIFESHGLLSGGAGGHVLQEQGTDLGGTFFRQGSLFGYRYPTFDGMVSLGFLAPGEQLRVQAKLIARMKSRLAGTGAIAGIGDPLDLKGDPGIDSEIVPDETIAVVPATFGHVKILFR